MATLQGRRFRYYGHIARKKVQVLCPHCKEEGLGTSDVRRHCVLCMTYGKIFRGRQKT